MINKTSVAFFLALIVVLLDQASKFWILNFLSVIDAKTLLPVLDLRLAMNHGVAFSLFNTFGMQTPWLLIGFTSVLSLAIIALILQSKSSENISRICYGLILGGALGNLIDRLRFGAVVDFIDCHIGAYHWPVFNLADSFICIGAFVLIVFSLIEGQHS